MAKLWQKKVELDKTMERFTVGEDPIMDLNLVEADVLGSIAHAKMLSEIGILTPEEFSRLRPALTEVLELTGQGKFTIAVEQEDVHTAVEEFLVAKVGDLGKKLHTARSRNDQSALDIRLYARDRLLTIAKLAADLARTCLDLADRHKDVPMVGRTHTQRAMPSSVGLWAGSFAEALIEDLELLHAIYQQTNRSPLGSAASYGVALPIDRERTAELLGMRPIVNVLFANNTRGRIEATILFMLCQIMNDLAKLAADTILFALPEFGYFLLPEKYCGGSSIMPQKKNPAPLELTRAKAATVQGHLFTVLGITRGLPSGYNRDLQETKAPLMRGLQIACDTLVVVNLIMRDVGVDAERCRQAFSAEVFAADAANELVLKGVPFRDAYRQIGLNLEALENRDPVANIRAKTHLGAPGNLALDRLCAQLREQEDRTARLAQEVATVKQNLLSL